MTTSPAWNIDSEYASLEAPAFAADYAAVEKAIADIEKRNGAKDIPTVQDLFVLREQALIQLRNLFTYTHCILSVDASDAKAKAMSSQLDDLASRLAQACTPLDIFVKTASDATLKSLLDHPKLTAYGFAWNQDRKKTPFLLSEGEETLLTAVGVSGHSAWETLYGNLCGTIKCQLKYPDRTETVGLAQALGSLFQKDELQRKTAWNAVQETWTEHQETSAAILNSLAGWRLEVNKKRSHTKPLHYLDTPLHENRIQRATLDAMLSACQSNLAQTRKAPALMAKVLKKTQLDPWDLLAPSPLGEESKTIEFSEAIKLVREAYGNVDPQLADFVDMMAKNNWIEGRVLPNKTTGAYCTYFPKSKQPRVYMTYMGSEHDVTTLAHELGHAFHSWSMRDLPEVETNYPMTLAETASVFGETALRETLLSKAKTNAEKLDHSWNELEAAAAFLINIPTRFEFEKNFYDKRAEKTLSPVELGTLMDEAWTKWYGPVLSKNDKLFWAHKLHFSIAGDNSFYNFPYTFGYLFSLSIYARRKELGADFMKTYVNVLRDTGRMTAEDLIQKHFGEDITQPQFWQKSFDLVGKKLTAIESLA